MSFLRPIAALGLVGISTGFAQPPGQPLIPPQPPANPIPGQPAAPAAPLLAPGVAAVPLAEQKVTEPIVEPKLSGTSLAGLYRKYTGRRVIVTSQAAIAEFSFVQDATPEDPLTYPQVAELLKKAATIENFVFVSDATDPNLDILTIATGGLNPKPRGLRVLTESDTLPEGDEVITYVMNLQYLKPDAAVATFNQVIGQFGAFGSIAPVANASSVIITENTSLIRRLIELKKEIDVPGGKVATRFIKVEYADVTELAATLNELLTAQQTAQRTAGVQRTGAQNAPTPIPGGAVVVDNGNGGGSSGEENPPQIVPEPRTNRVFVMGRPVDLIFIEGLVQEFDVPTDQRNFLRRKLSFLKVSEFLPIARNALTRAFSSGADAGGAAGGGAGGASGAAGGGAGGAGGGAGANASRNSNNRSMASTGSNNFGSGASGGSGGGAGSGASALSEPNVSTAPESDLVGRTLLVADNITNSIVVQGPPAGLEIIDQLLDQIDVKADQVMISCVFGQLTLTDGYSFGVDYVQTLGSNHAAGRGGSGQGGVIPLGPTTTAGVTTSPIFNPGSLAATGLGIYGNIGNNLNIYLDAKQDDSNFKVLSRPTIFTANNKKGSIVSGTQIAVPTSSFSSGTSATNSTNFEYKDVALQLEVVPLINSSREVTLQIYLTSDDVGQNRTVGTGGNAYTIPDILKRELITTVTVPNNETVVLGGLITETMNDSRSGIPILHRLPLVGPLFGTKSKDKDRSELLVFIQPSIVNSESTLDAAQVDMDARYKTSGETRRFSEGPGVLPPPDAVPLSDKASRSREAVIVEPSTPKRAAYPHGTRFRSSPR